MRCAVVAFLGLLLLSGLAGCISDGPETTVRLRITTDDGAYALYDDQVTIRVDWTVLDATRAATSVDAPGGYVQALAGHAADAKHAWFFEVDGQHSPVGAAEWSLGGGEHIHWDLRAWENLGIQGHFDSFRWDQAQVYVDHADPPAWLHGPRAEWNGTWPTGGPFQEPTVVRVTDAEHAPWDDLPGMTWNGTTLTVNGTPVEGAWGLTVRTAEDSHRRAVLVDHGRTPPWSQHGIGQVQTATGILEVRP